MNLLDHMPEEDKATPIYDEDYLEDDSNIEDESLIPAPQVSSAPPLKHALKMLSGNDMKNEKLFDFKLDMSAAVNADVEEQKSIWLKVFKRYRIRQKFRAPVRDTVGCLRLAGILWVRLGLFISKDGVTHSWDRSTYDDDKVSIQKGIITNLDSHYIIFVVNHIYLILIRNGLRQKSEGMCQENPCSNIR